MKKGFTLIELLAVIVILAVISLIAVPVVMDMISSSKNESNKISVKNYIRAVDSNLVLKEIEEQTTVADKTYSVMSDGNICLSQIINNTCSDVLNVKLDGERPISGSITISNNKVVGLTNLTYKTFKANMTNNGEISISKKENKNIICNAVNTSQKGNTQIGTKYNCAVNDTTSYNFYVLSNSGNNVNLIMENNIGSDVLFITQTYNGNPESYYTYISGKPYAVNEVEILTSTWTNITSLNETYTDRSGIYTVTLTGRARLPKFSELTSPSVCSIKQYCNDDVCHHGYDAYKISSPSYSGCPAWALGNYWTMDMNGNKSDYSVKSAWAMNTVNNNLDDFRLNRDNSEFNGDYIVCDEYVGLCDERVFGIRPVITVDKSNLG